MVTVILRESVTHAERQFLARFGSMTSEGLVQIPCDTAEPSAAGYLTVRFINNAGRPVVVEIPVMLVLMVFTESDPAANQQKSFGFASPSPPQPPAPQESAGTSQTPPAVPQA